MRPLAIGLRHLLIILLPLIAAASVPASASIAQSGTITLSTDRGQYRVGDTVHVCYGVAGPGPVTISDTLADGTTQTFFSAYDDGAGYCLDGTVTPPAGTECLQLNAQSAAGSGTAQACFQVVAQAPVTGTGGQDCGQIMVRGPQTVSSGAQSVEDCFFQAYQQCTPATLEVSFMGVDAGARDSFSLQTGDSGCVITATIQTYVAPRPPRPPMTVTCAGLTRSSDGGLLFSSCGSSDVTVPPGS